MSGGGKSQTETVMPAWAAPYAGALLKSYYHLVDPSNPLGDGGLNLPQMDPEMRSQVAGFTPEQQAGMGYLTGAAGEQQQLAQQGANEINSTLSGMYLSPESNPWLDQTYDAASRGLVNQYREATAPSLMAQAQRAGVMGGSAMDETQAYNQFNLGQNLSDLATQIYGGNYQQERGRQLQTMAMVPGAQSALAQPGQTLLGVGAYQQGQQQTEYDTATQNAIMQSQYPWQVLSGLGGGLSQSVMGTGMSLTKSPGK